MKANDEEAKAEAERDFRACARRFACVPAGDYRERRAAATELARASNAMVKALGRKDAEARMMRLSIEVMRKLREERR